MTRCHFYRRVCDLPAVIEPPHLGRIIMPATHVWALMMPAHLGQAVKIEIHSRNTDLGPILSHPRSRRWTYLVRPDLPDEDRLFAELFRLNISVVREGGTIALPSPGDQCAEFRCWVEPPRCIYRPSGLAVIDAIRACIDPGRWQAVTRG
ncbi:DNA-directed RNA polymerase subunit beta [Nocardia sp. NBC_01730]|uniref:DNA-directed RNA polymerase subunit beta n=1 Tax=Nocardia sp. NBC_01730 TaxID=2975998 RepID=UPI002E0EC838|nr:DNA-directed RNA polymerase subunit beta [Nocardia sp. NBC_01730]